MGPIIVEGFDNTGKTITAKKLARLISWPYIKSDAPPKMVPYDLFYGINELRNGANLKIQDRCFISELIYGSIIRNKIFLTNDDEQLLIQHLKNHRFTIIYCYRETENILKTWHEREQMNMTKQQIIDCILAYDDYMDILSCNGIEVVPYNFDTMGFDVLLNLLVSWKRIPSYAYTKYMEEQG